VGGDDDLAACHHARRSIEDQRFFLARRDADGHRISAQKPLAAPESRHIRWSVGDGEANQPTPDGSLHVEGRRSEVIAAAHPHKTDSGPLRQVQRLVHGAAPDHRPQAVVPVYQGNRRVARLHSNRRSCLDHAGLDSLAIHRQADQAMRVHAAQFGFQQAFRRFRRVVGRHVQPLQDCAAEPE